MTVNIDVRCYMNFGFFPDVAPEQEMLFELFMVDFKCELLKFARLCRIMTYLLPIIEK